MNRRSTVTRLVVAVVLIGPFVAAAGARAERPSAPNLLPENTFAYLRITNVPDLIQRFRNTAIGRIGGDERVKPLVSQLYRSAAEAFSRVEQRVGVPLEELLAIPQGEVCLAVVAPQEGQPQLLALVEVGDRLPAARTLIERVGDAMAEGGAAKTTERVGETELLVYDRPGDQQRRLVIVEKDQTVLVVSDLDLAKQVLAIWDGQQDAATLADNRRFTAIMNRCQGSEDERPQVTFYLDPIALAKRQARGNFAAQAGLATLSGLGLDGLKGVGGGITLATKEFDGIMHAHLLLANPRLGVLKMIALKTGEIEPEPWVPNDAAGYMTLHWDVKETYSELTRLYDTFRGENAWQTQVVAGISERLDVDFEKDILSAVEGRLSYVTWIEKPARLNSQANLVAIKLNDAKASQRTLDHVLGRFAEGFSKETYGGVSYYRVVVRGGNRQPDERLTRRPEPCITILGDYLILTDSSKFLQQAIVTKSGSRSLGGELDFKLIASKIQRQLGETKAGLVSFNRPEESFRLIYELATSEGMRSRLSTRAENNPFFRTLNDAMNDNPLPPFAVLAQYLAPGGAMVTSDETGFHYMAFTLRRE